jgi:hypothetical protein
VTKRRAAHSHRGWAALALALACVSFIAEPARAAAPHFAFAVISGVMSSPADEAPAQRLIGAIGLDPHLAFVVYDGNIKGASERCADALYDRRQQVLETAALPLVVIPGQHDWADCASASAGSYDAAERLDFLRQTLFSDTSSLGRPTLTLTRESEVARFHAFRENVRWENDDTVFVGLDVVGGNNHYSDAGGRNGEFDDRAIASSFWLEHAAELAKRHRAKALVVFIEADPDFSRYEEHADRFAWLRFARRRKPDGYLEFKRSLVKAAQTFRGPVVLVHHSAHAPTGGFTIDQPLYNDKGVRVANLTRIAIAPRDAQTQWVVVDVNYGRQVPFRISVRMVPKVLPALPISPMPAAPMEAPSSGASVPGTAIEPLPGIQYVMPAPQPVVPPPASAASMPQPAPPEPPLLPDPFSESPAGASPAMPAPPASTSSAPSGAQPPVRTNSMQGGGS